MYFVQVQLRDHFNIPAFTPRVMVHLVLSLIVSAKAPVVRYALC
jgi:hypothetical protein